MARTSNLVRNEDRTKMDWEGYLNLQYELLVAKTRILQIFHGRYLLDDSGLVLPNLYTGLTPTDQTAVPACHAAYIQDLLTRAMSTSSSTTPDALPTDSPSTSTTSATSPSGSIAQISSSADTAPSSSSSTNSAISDAVEKTGAANGSATGVADAQMSSHAILNNLAQFLVAVKEENDNATRTRAAMPAAEGEISRHRTSNGRQAKEEEWEERDAIEAQRKGVKGKERKGGIKNRRGIERSGGGDSSEKEEDRSPGLPRSRKRSNGATNAKKQASETKKFPAEVSHPREGIAGERGKADQLSNLAEKQGETQKTVQSPVDSAASTSSARKRRQGRIGLPEMESALAPRAVTGPSPKRDESGSRRVRRKRNMGSNNRRELQQGDKVREGGVGDDVEEKEDGESEEAGVQGSRMSVEGVKQRTASKTSKSRGKRKKPRAGSSDRGSREGSGRLMSGKTGTAKFVEVEESVSDIDEGAAEDQKEDEEEQRRLEALFTKEVERQAASAQARKDLERFRNPNYKTRPREIVVIGGGISGITAANELQARGFTVTILEARDRLGGRVRTMKREMKGSKSSVMSLAIELGGGVLDEMCLGNELDEELFHELPMKEPGGQTGEGSFVRMCASTRMQLVPIPKNSCQLYESDSGNQIPKELDDGAATHLHQRLSLIYRARTLWKSASPSTSADASKDDPSSRSSIQECTEVKDMKDFVARIRSSTSLQQGLDMAEALVKSLADRSPAIKGKLPDELALRILNWHQAVLEGICGSDLSRVSLFGWDQEQQASASSSSATRDKQQHTSNGSSSSTTDSLLRPSIYTQEPSFSDDERPTTSNSSTNESGQRWLVKQGMAKMLESAAFNAGVEVRLNCPVSSIDYSDDDSPVVINTSQGTFHADLVLVTLPLGVLKTEAVKFSPPLPEDKRSSIERLGCGLVNKIVLFFPTIFWDRGVHFIGQVPAATPGQTPEDPSDGDQIKNAVPVDERLDPRGTGVRDRSDERSSSEERCDPQSQRGFCYTFENLARSLGYPVLVGWVSGEAARRVEEMPDAQVIAAAMCVLRKIYPKAPAPLKSIVTRWGKDPLALGAFSFIPPSASAADLEILADPIAGRLFFAGEATNRLHPASIAGAFQSGLREARRISLLYLG